LNEKKNKIKETVITIAVIALLGAAILTVCGVFGDKDKDENTDVNKTVSVSEDDKDKDDEKNSDEDENEDKSSEDKNDEENTDDDKSEDTNFTPLYTDTSLNTGNLTENADKYEGKKGTGDFNYGEALQKAILFYDLQRSGDLPENVRCNWRGDSGLTDGSDVGLDLTGGFYDAGDHVKFNLPMAYTSTMLAWSVYEDLESYEESGQLPYILDNIKWVNDYLIKCHPEDDVYYYQVGDGNLDHAWWGPCEVMQMERPSYKVDKENPGSAVSAEAAASLAACSIVFDDTDSKYAKKCLEHAKSLYEFAEETKSDEGYTAANGFYNSWSGFYDELAWAGMWLYLATDDKDYLKKSEEYLSQVKADEVYKWAQCWDDVYIGATVLLSQETGDSKYSDIIEKHLDFWTDGCDGEQIKYTPEGLAWVDQWGSLRYATTTAFLAGIYSESDECTKSKKEKYQDFLVSQVNYALGSSGRSFVVGFGENPPQNPHHRTAHSSWSDNLNNPETQAHTLYGALVGGPDSADGYEDVITNYTTNEVACDYNAGFIGALAKLYKEYGGQTLVDFGAVEVPDRNELYVENTVNASGNDFTEIKSMIYNMTSWPARVTDKLELRYFIDLSEVYDAGGSADNIEISMNYAQDEVTATLVPWNEENHIYYVSVDFSGVKVYPGGQSAYKKEVQFRIKNNGGVWDPSNDFSFTDIEGSNGSTLTEAMHCALYDGDTLVFGSEPNDRTAEKPNKNENKKPDKNDEEQKPDDDNDNEETVTTSAQKTNKKASNENEKLKVELKQENSSGNNNTITFEVNITNLSDSPVFANDLSVLYYFTAENADTGNLNMYCDNSAITSPSAYKSITGVKGEFSETTGENADTVCTISSSDKSQIGTNESLKLQIRISKTDWSDFTMNNDHSAGNAENIVVMSGNDILIGNKP